MPLKSIHNSCTLDAVIASLIIIFRTNSATYNQTAHACVYCCDRSVQFLNIQALSSTWTSDNMATCAIIVRQHAQPICEIIYIRRRFGSHFTTSFVHHHHFDFNFWEAHFSCECFSPFHLRALCCAECVVSVELIYDLCNSYYIMRNRECARVNYICFRFSHRQRENEHCVQVLHFGCVKRMSCKLWVCLCLCV